MSEPISRASGSSTAPPLIIVAGPTGSGKSELAVDIATAIGGEIVNYDSVQIYRGFDVGSAKPSMAMRARVPHHLYDIVDAEDEFNAAGYARIAGETCDALISRSVRPVLVGGTYFYLRALLTGLPEMPGRDEGVRSRLVRIGESSRGQARLHRWLARVDPMSGARIAPADRHRTERALQVWISTGRPISSWQAPTADQAPLRPAIKIALRVDRQVLVQRLDARVVAMYAGGLVEEARRLLERHSRSSRPFTTIGYREALALLDGRLTEPEAIAETQRRTRAYAKRQMTWLRSERDVQWLDATDRETLLRDALRVIDSE
jgi:tRNA dimethylallyltransferase